MPKECWRCQWQRWAWCSIRDRLVSKGITPPCVVPTGDELAEALAEIESLRKELLQEDDHFRHIRARLTTQREYWEKRCLKAEYDLAHLEILSADAKLGKMVRGMLRGSSLIHTGPFATAKSDWIAHRPAHGPHPSYQIPATYTEANDPAEALRSIQEVGDDEA